MYRKPFVGFATAYPQRIAARRPQGAPVSRSFARIAHAIRQQAPHPAPAPSGRSFRAIAGQIKQLQPPPVMAQRIPALVRGLMAPGGTYLGEDDSFYYWMDPGATDQLGGLFDNIGGTFKKIGKAFQPKNLYKTFIDTTLTIASGGLYLAAPKKLKGQIRNVANIAVPVIAGGVLAYTAGPAVMSALMPKLKAAGSLLYSGASKAGSFIQAGAGKLFGGGKGGGGSQDAGSQVIGQATGQGYQEGGGVDPIAIGGAVINLLNRLPQHKQAEVIDRLTPEDIAYMERYQQIPPHLQGYFNELGQPTLQGSSGAASLYPGAMPAEGPAQAGMFAGMDTNTMLLIGVPAAFFLLSQLGGNGSRKK